MKIWAEPTVCELNVSMTMGGEKSGNEEAQVKPIIESPSGFFSDDMKQNWIDNWDKLSSDGTTLIPPTIYHS